MTYKITYKDLVVVKHKENKNASLKIVKKFHFLLKVSTVVKRCPDLCAYIHTPAKVAYEQRKEPYLQISVIVLRQL
jgi:hypothetical protein